MTVLISLALIFAYTYRGGLKRSLSPILYKHFFLVTSIFLTIVFICNSLDFSAIEAFEAVKTATTLKYSFEDFISSKFHFVKKIVGGIFVTIAMVGLDQDLMQKIWCATIGEAQKNMFTFTGYLSIIFFLSVVFILANALKYGMKRPTIIFSRNRAFNHLALIPSIILLGLTADLCTTDSA
jgi:hypothetical protein